MKALSPLRFDALAGYPPAPAAVSRAQVGYVGSPGTNPKSSWLSARERLERMDNPLGGRRRTGGRKRRAPCRPSSTHRGTAPPSRLHRRRQSAPRRTVGQVTARVAGRRFSLVGSPRDVEGIPPGCGNQLRAQRRVASFESPEGSAAIFQRLPMLRLRTVSRLRKAESAPWPRRSIAAPS